MLFTEAAFLLVDLIKIEFSRIFCDQLFDIDQSRGLLLVKLPQFNTPVIYSIESQQTVCQFRGKEQFWHFEIVQIIDGSAEAVFDHFCEKNKL